MCGKAKSKSGPLATRCRVRRAGPEVLLQRLRVVMLWWRWYPPHGHAAGIHTKPRLHCLPHLGCGLVMALVLCAGPLGLSLAQGLRLQMLLVHVQPPLALKGRHHGIAVIVSQKFQHGPVWFFRCPVSRAKSAAFQQGEQGGCCRVAARYSCSRFRNGAGRTQRSRTGVGSDEAPNR